MNLFLLLSAIVILACVLCNRLSNKLGVPTLLAFILLGMFFGCDGVVKIPFENYTLAQNICSVALIFIMFYGGFGTNWAQARPVAVKATVLSSLGTLGTAGLVGLFCWKVLGLEMLLGFLLGAVIASTDAASVFSILRSKHLDLKEGTASLLEVESGSNDPFSYMLTVILLSLMSGSMSIRSSRSWSMAVPWVSSSPWPPGNFHSASAFPRMALTRFFWLPWLCCPMSSPLCWGATGT